MFSYFHFCFGRFPPLLLLGFSFSFFLFDHLHQGTELPVKWDGRLKGTIC